MGDVLAGRSYAQVYRVMGRSDLHEYLRAAVGRAGGEVLYVSPRDRAPVYLGIQGPNDERVGVLCYPFRCTVTKRCSIAAPILWNFYTVSIAVDEPPDGTPGVGAIPSSRTTLYC
jgi:hypothetical protein